MKSVLRGWVCSALAMGVLPAIASANPYCGDEKIQAGEGCDDGNQNDGDGCEHNCLLPDCGNGEVDPGEQCDDGNEIQGDGCQDTCLLPSCGDGVKDFQFGEQCDHGVNNSDEAPDHCRTDCTKPRCGDGAVDTGEICDDGNNLGLDNCPASCKHEGCNNKFWLERKHWRLWIGYRPEQGFNETFGIQCGEDVTLFAALSASGSDVFLVFQRHAVAALLNAASGRIGYAYTLEEVIGLVQEACRTGDFQRIKNLLSKENFSDCPL